MHEWMTSVTHRLSEAFQRELRSAPKRGAVNMARTYDRNLACDLDYKF